MSDRNRTSGNTKSVWMDSNQQANDRPALDRDISADVCVVGAGIAGLSVAYELAVEGKQVVVLDDGPIGSGESLRTTAHLVNALDDRYYELEKFQGADGARVAADSHTRAVDRIEEILGAENIDCDFRRLDGYLFAAPGDDVSQLQTELEATHRVGLTNVEKLSRAPIVHFDTGPCLRFPQQGQFHIAKYLQGLARAIEARGGKIFCGTHVDSVTGGDSPRVTTSNGVTVNAKAVAVCTNTPINDMVAVHTKQMAYRTYVIALDAPVGSVQPALYWDTPDPYHYVRLQGDGSADDILIVGGEDHKTGQPEDTSADERFARLEAWARERWPQVGEVKYRWSGQVMEPDDGTAFIGRNPLDEKNIYIATGDSGNGMTHGVIAGMLIRDLVLGRDSPWVKLYEPRRIRLAATGEWLKENLNTFAQYRNYATPGEVASADEIAAGQGAVLREGMGKVACYRDESGCLHKLSAVCPHLGGVVRWNAAEKSWDCPAHGSRFKARGEVVNGPANSNLAKVESEDKAA